METQTCVCVPLEDGMNVYASTQYVDLQQIAIATCLGVPQNTINVSVKRVGGAFGSKISRSAQISCACALACRKLNRPARFIMTMESNMSSVGKRPPAREEYEVGVDSDGKIQYMNSKHWSVAGAIFNEPMGNFVEVYFPNCYDPATWHREEYETKSNTPTNTWFRGPGAVETVGMIEHIMDHIASQIRRDPIDVRFANADPADNNTMIDLVKDVQTTADYETRKKAIANFNCENRWKKKGIAVLPMKWPLAYEGTFDATAVIYPHDGTVAITHGGVEIGQGINTKMAQVAAYILGIDVEMISVKPTTNFTSPNNSLTGGSWTSDSCAYATMMACKELVKRMEPIKAELNNPTWKELTMAAYEKQVDLSARYLFGTTRDDVQGYNIWGCAITEVEIDLLTGEHIIPRADLLVDTGVSMSPEIDIGQVEGGFVMGLGYWTSEDLIYDPDTGVLRNNRSWNYKPPGAKDIPVDFRVSFRRNAPNPFGVLRSKTTGEPPLCLSYVIVQAIRSALNAARNDAGNTDKWYNLDGPVTTEKILLTSLTSRDQMIL